LGDEFQYKHLLAVLRQLSGVHTLVLNHNMLTDVSDVYLPHVEVLYVSNNEFTSLKRLPRCPNLRTLNCGHNHIKDAGGLEAFPHLESLVLRWNPIADDKDYQAKIRKVVQKKLPKFKFLDELPFQ
jgi:Leucine-rich repeat (LRR) protein